MALFAQFATAEQQSSQDFSKAAVVIKTFDRTMYYPNTASNNPINVTVSITNNGSDTLRFKLADERMFSLDFSANDIKNTKVKPPQYLTERRSSKNSIYYRDITIESGETYSFVENVKNYIDFETPSIYYLQLDFYPDLYKSKNVKITSNRLSLDIRPAPIVSTASALPVENETESVLKPEAISPD
ncbi:MAG: hypothetical protein IJ673_08855, partial [Treponema sp.]|nr:hypothetical protein [Treponema sp.]